MGYICYDFVDTRADWVWSIAYLTTGQKRIKVCYGRLSCGRLHRMVLQQFAKLQGVLSRLYRFESYIFRQICHNNSNWLEQLPCKEIVEGSSPSCGTKYETIAQWQTESLKKALSALVRVQLVSNGRVLTTWLAYINTNPISKIAYARILTTLGICGISQYPYLIVSRYVLYMGFMLDLMASGCDGQRKNLSFDEWAI